MISLRPYQEDLHVRSKQALESGKRSPLVVAPCGAGKTVLFSNYTQKVAARGKRTVILSHREELVQQISDTLTLFDVDHSFISGDRPYRRNVLTQVATVMSLAKRIEAEAGIPEAQKTIPTPDLIIVDEAHHGVAGTWKRIFTVWPYVRRIGVTATPERLDGQPLGDIYDDMIIGPSPGELIEMGFLSDYVVLDAGTTIYEGINHPQGSDKWLKEVKKRRRNAPKIVGDAIEQYSKHCAGKRAVVFEVSVFEAKATAEKFNAAGWRAACIDGGMPAGKRKETVQLFRDGFLDVLSTCELVSEGFDLPAIEVGIMLRPTESRSLWIQQFGRTLRTFPGKDKAMILDHCGNTMRHMWLPETEMEWSLTGPSRIKQAEDSGPPLRRCLWCGNVQFKTAGLKTCNRCGVLFSEAPVVAPKPLTKVDGELVEMTPERMALIAKKKRIEQGRAQTFEELVEMGRKRGYDNPVWHAKKIWESRLKKEAQRKLAESRQQQLGV